MTEDRSGERSSLPVLWEPPAGDARGGKEAYVPRHALQVPRRRDRTNLWLWMLLFLSSSFVVGTTAAFNATVGDSGNAFGSVSLGVPGSPLTLTPSGTNLTASVATFGGFDAGSGTVGVRWRYHYPTGVPLDGSAPYCGTANSEYPSTQDLGGSITTARTVSQNDFPGMGPGRWTCVMAFTTYPAADPVLPAVQWLSQAGNPRVAVQTGHVVQKVALANKSGGVAGTIEDGDTIAITFNQDVDPTNGRPTSGGVCLDTSTGSYVLVGQTCNGSLPSSVSMLALVPKTGVTTTLESPLNFSSSSWSWTSNRTLTITLAGGLGNGRNKNTYRNNAVFGGCTGTTPCFTGSTAWTFGATGTTTGSADSTLRSAGQPHLPLCKAQPAGAPDAGICHPDVTGSF